MTLAKILPHHRRNLEKLATHLESLPADYERFGMRDFLFKSGEISWRASIDLQGVPRGGKPVCGTVACAIGHGIAAGIKRDGVKCWAVYTTKNFVEFDTHEFEWLFGSGWWSYDDTPQGAAARIRYYLENGGIPVDHNRKDKTIQCYAPYLKEDA